MKGTHGIRYRLSYAVRRFPAASGKGTAKESPRTFPIARSIKKPFPDSGKNAKRVSSPQALHMYPKNQNRNAPRTTSTLSGRQSPDTYPPSADPNEPAGGHLPAIPAKTGSLASLADKAAGQAICPHSKTEIRQYPKPSSIDSGIRARERNHGRLLPAHAGAAASSST